MLQSVDQFHQFVVGLLSADGRRLATGGADRVVHMWDARDPAAPPLWSVTDEPVNHVAFGPDGTTLACATGHPALRLRDAATGELRRTFEGHTSGLQATAFSGDGRVLASVSSDRSARLWNAQTGECTATAPFDLIAVKAIGLSLDGTRLLTAASDESQIWELTPGGAGGTPRPLATLLGHRNALTSAALSPDGRHAVTASIDGTLKAWEVGHSPACRLLAGTGGHAGWVFGVCFDPTGARLASGADDDTIRISASPWESMGSALQFSPRPPQPRFWTRALAFYPDGALLAAGSCDGVIRLIDPAANRVVGEMSASKSEVFSVSFSPDGRVLAAAGGNDRVVRFWDVPSRAEIGSVTGFGARVLGVAFLPQGSTVAASAEDGVRLLDGATFKDLGLLPGSAPSWSVAVSRDGRWLAAGGSDGVIRLWDLSTRGEPLLLQGHKRLAAGVAFSPDSTLLASGSDDATVRLWDVPTGVNLATIETGRGEVSHVACSPDGRTIAAACQRNSVVIVDLDHFRPHIAGNLDYRLSRHRADLPEGTTPEQVRAAILDGR